MLVFRCAWTRSNSTGMDVDDTLSFCPANSLDPLPALMVEATQAGDDPRTIPILLDINQVVKLRNHLDDWISLVGGQVEDPARPAVEGYI